ncbi:MarR family transcriptional regulator [Gallaecimonas sp. GXIMD4217]|uniref:MarR family winged helix-turn-helix transcriptional regulator n=1 Tax=Gallaecimonas sp. GXIMD4217 TaxID=3131927 RepID=UPI00311B300C
MALAQSLMALQRQLTRAWAAQGLEGELSYSEFEYLKLVQAAEEARPSGRPHDDSSHLSTLAAELQVQKSSASTMVKKLEKRGLVKRIPCQFDARAQHILLTDQGRTLLTQAQAAVYDALEQRLAAGLGEAEYARLEGCLARLCEQLSASAG